METVHGGDVRELARRAGIPVKDFLDFSASINPLGPPPWLRSLLSRETENLVHYPDRHASELRKAIGECYGLDPECLVAGNGTTELIYNLPRAFEGLLSRAVIPVPSYGDYEDAVRKAGIPADFIELKEEEGFLPDFGLLGETLRQERGRALVFLGRPNNPTSTVFPMGPLLSLADDLQRHIFCIDEAFADFIPGYRSAALEGRENIIVLRSCTKFFAFPGLRLGWMWAGRETAKALSSLLPTWSVNSLSQAAGVRAMRDGEYRRRSVEYTIEERRKLEKGLGEIRGLKIFPGSVNFIFGRILRSGITAGSLQDFLLPRGIALRNCGSFRGLDDSYFRLAVRTSRENEKLLDSLREFFRAGKRGKPGGRKKRVPALMFQGTSSNAGKSLMTAAFCRMLFQKGYRPAPFKAQNMALNSFVTTEGLEIGRAQAVQAQACRIEPEVRMNPVLLKPLSENRSQVIVRGKPLDVMSFGTYENYREKLLEAVRTSYDSLSRDFDVIVIEGAGSPGEINLREKDIVNMEMAEYADSPVILVGDIDRGGLYASFLGTMEIMSESDRRRVGGYLVNKFRGDQALLEPAHSYLSERTGVDVLGVVPYINGLDLPEEDSVSFKEAGGVPDISPSTGDNEGKEFVTLVCVDFPYISNFTDLDALRREPDVQIFLVRNVRELKSLGRIDALILPGSKNVYADLRFLRSSGIAGIIAELRDEGRTEIVGLCGGLQMLGSKILNESHVENDSERVEGLGLLKVSTKLARRKILTRIEAVHEESGLEVKGYEIHHGRTDGRGEKTGVVTPEGKPLGWQDSEGMVWGTYLHGLFDGDRFRRWFLNRLRERRGLSPLPSGAIYDLEPVFDRLAKVFRESADVERILRLTGLE